MRGLVLLVVLLSAHSFAHARGGGSDGRARAAFDEGNALFRAGRYEAAIGAFTRGYALVPQPLFLYDIAQAARLSKQPAKAITYYGLYLTASPHTPERRRILALIDRLRQATPVTDEPEVAAPFDTIRPSESSAAEESPSRTVENSSRTVDSPPRVDNPPRPVESTQRIVDNPRRDLDLTHNPADVLRALEAPTPAPLPPRRRLRPWHWALIGGAVAVAAAGVGVAVVYARPAGPPVTDLGNVRSAP
jgi:hypothetical protein